MLGQTLLQIRNSSIFHPRGAIGGGGGFPTFLSAVTLGLAFPTRDLK